MMIIGWLLRWTPFKIDALGLVTMLGADEVNKFVGRLSSSRVTEYLPLVSSFVIANDGIKSAIPGFELYNVSDGICATDIVGWFSRWLLSQRLTYNSTTLTINTRQSTSQSRDGCKLAAGIGGTVCFLIILIPIMISDWWGLVNATGLGVSVLVRSVILDANRYAIDQSARTSTRQSNTVVKVFCTMSNGCVVTIYAPRGIVTQCLLSEPRLADQKRYFIARMVGWVAFLVHVVALGMASLPNQLLTVLILAASTTCVALRVGSNDECIGQQVVIQRFDDHGPDKSMASCFARLRLSREEEEGMVAWKLMPQTRNEVWWRK